MALKQLKDASTRAFTAAVNGTISAAQTLAEGTSTAARHTYNATATGVNLTFNAAASGASYTLEGIEYMDKKFDQADDAMENAVGTAGGKAAGIFGERAKPYGERLGKISYKATKIGINFIQLPGVWRQSIDLLRALRR